MKDNKGNVFFLVLIGVLLFAGLMMTFSKGVRQGGNNLSSTQAGLAADDLMAFAQKVERTIGAMMADNISEEQFNFVGAPSSAGNYATPACSANRCKPFHADGGGLEPIIPQSSWFDTAFSGGLFYGMWMYTSQYCVNGVGRTGACVDGTDAELMMIIYYIKPEICEALNKRLGLAEADPNGNMVGLSATIRFNGNFPANGGIGVRELTGPNTDGRKAACIFNSNANHYAYYQVLIAR